MSDQDGGSSSASEETLAKIAALFFYPRVEFERRTQLKLPKLSRQSENLIDGSLSRNVATAAVSQKVSAVDALIWLCMCAQNSWFWNQQYTFEAISNAPWGNTVSAMQYFLHFDAGISWHKIHDLMKGGEHPALPSDDLIDHVFAYDILDLTNTIYRLLDWIEASSARANYSFYRIHPKTRSLDSPESLIASAVVAFRISVEREKKNPELARGWFLKGYQVMVDSGICPQPELHPADPLLKTASLGVARPADLWLISLWPVFRSHRWTARRIYEWTFHHFGKQGVPTEDYKDFGTHLRRLGLFGAAGRGTVDDSRPCPALEELDTRGDPGEAPLQRWLDRVATSERP